MKNLKKTLAMVLVVATMLSILVIGAGAAFTDQADVDYAEAVEVLSAIKVLEGFEDGSFKPDGILTREQAAKIIAYVMLGKTAADALTTQTAPFKDVAATRWSAGYIAFCVNQGIINGYGDGRFGPADKLTGFQFAKMLLCALGYGKNDEFIGSNWTIEVAKLAIPLGIFDGNTAGASNAACTREAAALYTLNAMTGAMTVNYSEVLGTYYAGTNALNSPVDLIEELTLGYQVYRLAAADAQQGGRSGHRWTVNGDYITVFYGDDTVIATSTDGTELLNLVTRGMQGFKAELDDTYYVYFNGVALPNSSNIISGYKYFDANARAIKTDDGDGIADSDDAVYAIKRGAVVELIDTADTGNKIDVINIVEKEIKVLVTDPVVAGGYVTIPGVISKTAVEYVIGYDKVKTGDYVAVVTIDGVTTIEPCTTVTGTITSVSTANGITSYTINGTSYKVSELPNADAAASLTVPNYKDAMNYTIDPAGYIAHVSAATFVFDNYGVVLDADGASFSAVSGQGAYAKAQILKSDGTVAIFDIVNPATQLPWVTVAQGLTDGELYAYKLDSAGRIYEITAATAVTPAEDADGIDVINGTAQIDIYHAYNPGYPPYVPEVPAGIYPTYLNSRTVFFFYDDSGAMPVYSVVTGHTNVSTKLDVMNYSQISFGGTVSALLLKGTVDEGASDVVFISSDDFSTGMLESGVLYYTYNCFIDGKADTINLAAQITDGPAPYIITKNPVTGLYTARVVNNITDNQVMFADSNYFVDTTTTYKITGNTEVYRVFFDLDRNVVDVQLAGMVASSFFGDVNLVGYESVGDVAACVFYEVNYYGYNNDRS